MSINPDTGDTTPDTGSVTGDIIKMDSGGGITSDTADPNVSSANVSTANVHAADASGLGSYTCVIKTDSTPDGIHAGQPWDERNADTRGTVDFAHFPYSKKNARTIYTSSGHYQTLQAMLCTVGGAQSDPTNGWRLFFAGSAVTLSQSTWRKIGQNWGSGNHNNTASSTLSFQLAVGIVTIGATVPVSGNSGGYGGDIGADGKFPGYWHPHSYDVNRTNTFYSAPHKNTWDGSTAYQGNTSQVLTEWPVGSTGTFKWVTYDQMGVFNVRSAS